jgi:hypothetical protein
MAETNLRITRTFGLPDELADALVDRLTAADAQMVASHITYARSDPQGNELPREDWPKMRAVLDAWANEEELDPRLEQLRQFVAPDTA